MDGFHHELSEDDMILSQVLETLEDEMELRNVNIEDFFGEFPSNVMDENASGDLINTSAVSFDLGLDLDLWLQVPLENGKIQNCQGTSFFRIMPRADPLLHFEVMKNLKNRNKEFESRFAEMTDHEIDTLIEDTENNNTKKATKWAVNVYKDWQESKIGSGLIIPNLKDLSVQDINNILGKFVVEVRKRDGEKYPAKTLYLLVTGLLRGMRSQGVSNLNFLNESGDRFLRFRQILDAQINKLTSDGYGINVKQADPISVEQEKILCLTFLSDGSVKFDHILGANRLGLLMKTICQKGELKGNFSNHSGKRTLATRLYQAGVSEQMIMDRTGHRSEKAFRTYKRPADFMLKDVSNILNPSNKQIKLEDPKPLTDTRAILPEQVNIENTENAFNVSKPEEKYRDLPSNSSFQNCVFNFVTKM
ncbi:Hypothetical predicted protein [Mytilus galloprovincialis]|uniref:Tyr recombinase domain-containing protein n=1 Tax=Mytilus galloprovincialis TaxID=29158 RepID=A0A8B6DDU5_MYTGA|nr:Hypothetical predicted protein [Mytilus galloprovincialis]